MATAGACILVIEDRPYLRQALVTLLEGCGYRAVGFASAAEALGRLPELAPRLVLLDMQLPGMSGREFLQRLRASARWDHVPVLIVSGFGETEPPSPDRSIAVLAKPVEPGTLLAWVGRMLAPPPAETAVTCAS